MSDHFTRSLRCELTDQEIHERAQTAARMVVTIDELESAAKAEAKRRKTFIEEKEAELRRLSAEIRDKATFREIDCERLYDYKLGLVREVRTDTGELLSERAMTYSERQLELDIDEEPEVSIMSSSELESAKEEEPAPDTFNASELASADEPIDLGLRVNEEGDGWEDTSAPVSVDEEPEVEEPPPARVTKRTTKKAKKKGGRR